MQQEASTTLEIEITLEGVVSHPDATVGEAGPAVEDVSIDGVYGLTYVAPRRWSRTDLLAGLDDDAKAIIRNNIMRVIGETDAAHLVLEAA